MRLRRHQLGVQFRRQHPIGPYLVDFCCVERMMVVELDGGGRVTGWMASVRAENEHAIVDRVHYVVSYKPGVQFAKDAPAPS